MDGLSLKLVGANSLSVYTVYVSHSALLRDESLIITSNGFILVEEIDFVSTNMWLTVQPTRQLNSK